jgi:glycosyltransferase involved in cell wall biosynthesis
VTVVQRKEHDGELPLIFQYYTTDEMTIEIRKHLNEKYDFIQIDFLTMAYYVFKIKEITKLPVFFTEHDVSSFYFDRCFHNRHLSEKDRYIEWVRMRKMMDGIYGLFDAIFTVSENDAEILRGKLPGKNIYPAPTGTDCDYYAFKPAPNSGDLVFVGHFLHYPNVDSVNYLISEILPLIKKKCPQIKTKVVGSGGKEAFRDMADPDIIVTGTVPDIREYLYNSRIFVAPIRIGIGIRGKILEAMSCGLPVVSTLLGAEGIGARNAEHLLVADRPELFASHVKALIDDEDLRNRLINRGREFVEQKYNWPDICRSIMSLYGKLLSS